MIKNKILFIASILSITAFIAPAVSFAQYSSYSDCIAKGGIPEDCSTVFPSQAPSPTLTAPSGSFNTPTNGEGSFVTPPRGGRDVGNTNTGPVNASLPNPLKATSLIAVINGLATFMLEASILIATLLIIFGAFQILTSAGSSDKVEAGKKTILYTVVGLGIMLLFKVILAVIGQLLGVNVSTNLLQ